MVIKRTFLPIDFFLLQLLGRNEIDHSEASSDGEEADDNGETSDNSGNIHCCISSKNEH